MALRIAITARRSYLPGARPLPEVARRAATPKSAHDPRLAIKRIERTLEARRSQSFYGLQYRLGEVARARLDPLFLRHLLTSERFAGWRQLREGIYASAELPMHDATVASDACGKAEMSRNTGRSAREPYIYEYQPNGTLLGYLVRFKRQEAGKVESVSQYFSLSMHKGAKAALRATRRWRSLPSLVLAGGAPDAAEGIALLADRPMREGKATAYVCRGSVCDEPVTEARWLFVQLSAAIRTETPL